MEHRIALLQELVRSVREVRNRYSIEKTSLDIYVRCSGPVANDFRLLSSFITLLAGVGRLECGPDTQKPPQSATHVHPEFESYVSLKALIAPEAEATRTETQLAEKRRQ